MTKNNAVILAAGGFNDRVSNEFDVPKALYRVGGEALIERQIRQLRAAGISDITVVLGFRKEQLLFLEEKYDVRLIINKNFVSKGNLWSLYLAKDYIKSTYILFCDNYFAVNLFTTKPSKGAYRICCERKGSSEFYVDVNKENYITRIRPGNFDGLCMTGFAYFSEKFSEEFFSLLESQIDLFGTDRLFWEEFVQTNLPQLKLKARIVATDIVREFDSLSDVKSFQSDIIGAVDRGILNNIANVLHCEENDITNVDLISKGLTNVSFKFSVNNGEYIYRHPGHTSSVFANREAEYFAQNIAKDEGIDRTYVAMNINRGWKIAKFVPNCTDFDYKNVEQVKCALGLLKKLHDTGAQSPYNFDPFAEADRLLKLASHGSPRFIERFSSLRNMIRRIWLFTELEGVQKVICHNDAYAVNFLVGNGEVNIIDWEYSGNNDPAYDLGCIIARDDISEDQANQFIEVYLKRRPTEKEYRHFIAYFAIAGWYWFCWCLAKNSIGDDFGWWYMKSFHTAKNYGKKALSLMQGEILL